MKILDLGQMDTPLLLFGGAHSNLQASEALLKFARAEGFGPKQVICTGDLVAYCGQPSETVALFREFGCTVLAGNCEKQLAENALDCGCGFEDGTACDLLSAGWYAHANRNIGTEDRRWMADLPDLIRFEHCGNVFAVVHGGATVINRFLWSVSDDAEFLEEIDYLTKVLGAFDVVVAGHSGIAFERRVGGKSWINAGAIGLPPHNGGQTTQFATLFEGKCTFYDLKYDVGAAQEKMVSAGLTQGYHTTLQSGYWPSEDILPLTLRRTESA